MVDVAGPTCVPHLFFGSEIGDPKVILIHGCHFDRSVYMSSAVAFVARLLHVNGTERPGNLIYIYVSWTRRGWKCTCITSCSPIFELTSTSDLARIWIKLSPQTTIFFCTLRGEIVILIGKQVVKPTPAVSHSHCSSLVLCMKENKFNMLALLLGSWINRSANAGVWFQANG